VEHDADSAASAVFVVDDDAALRDSLRLLAHSMGLRVETYPSAEAFLDAYSPARPGCLILEVRLPGMSGLELQEALAARQIGLPIIIVSRHVDVPTAMRVIRSGAVDVIKKPYDSNYLKQRIREAIEKDVRERQAQGRRRACAERFASLTAREREVMLLLVQGKNVKEIALELDLSSNTVQIHRARILKKARVDSVSDLVWLVVGAGIRGPEHLPEEA
jgi:FixJ family two-component response regulator